MGVVWLVTQTHLFPHSSFALSILPYFLQSSRSSLYDSKEQKIPCTSCRLPNCSIIYCSQGYVTNHTRILHFYTTTVCQLYICSIPTLIYPFAGSIKIFQIFKKMVYLCKKKKTLTQCEHSLLTFLRTNFIRQLKSNAVYLFFT